MPPEPPITRVRFTQKVNGFTAGQETDLPTETANNLIRGKLAQRVAGVPTPQLPADEPLDAEPDDTA